jgi:hypothetical protein
LVAAMAMAEEEEARERDMACYDVNMEVALLV